MYDNYVLYGCIYIKTKITDMTQRLKKIYFDNVVPKLLEQFEFENMHQVPKLTKIIINCGVGEAVENSKLIESTLQDLTVITGQKPIVTRAKKSIAGFALRAKMPVGVCVTLRGDTMYAFLDRLINLALPRIRDFQGLKKSSFDGYGNFHLGLKEQLMFPEIEYDKVQKIRGMDISIVTSCRTNIEAFHFLAALGMPFQINNQTI
jgi:large subunit ribosomal protein L5